MTAGSRRSVLTSLVWSRTAAMSFLPHDAAVFLTAPRTEITHGIHPEPRIPQRLRSVQMLDARLQVDDDIARLVVHALLDVDGDAAQRVDDGCEASEVRLDRVIHREAGQQISRYRFHEQGGPAVRQYPLDAWLSLFTPCPGTVRGCRAAGRAGGPSWSPTEDA